MLTITCVLTLGKEGLIWQTLKLPYIALENLLHAFDMSNEPERGFWSDRFDPFFTPKFKHLARFWYRNPYLKVHLTQLTHLAVIFLYILRWNKVLWRIFKWQILIDSEIQKKTRNISEIEWLDFDGSQKDTILKNTKSDFEHENKIQKNVEPRYRLIFKDQDIQFWCSTWNWLCVGHHRTRFFRFRPFPSDLVCHIYIFYLESRFLIVYNISMNIRLYRYPADLPVTFQFGNKSIEAPLLVISYWYPIWPFIKIWAKKSNPPYGTPKISKFVVHVLES